MAGIQLLGAGRPPGGPPRVRGGWNPLTHPAPSNPQCEAQIMRRSLPAPRSLRPRPSTGGGPCRVWPGSTGRAAGGWRPAAARGAARAARRRAQPGGTPPGAPPAPSAVRRARARPLRSRPAAHQLAPPPPPPRAASPRKRRTPRPTAAASLRSGSTLLMCTTSRPAPRCVPAPRRAAPRRAALHRATPRSPAAAAAAAAPPLDAPPPRAAGRVAAGQGHAVR